MVARGEFREDLLYRINLIAIHLPPLRERPDDIPLLASRFLQAAAAGLSARAADADAGRGALAAGAAVAGQRPAAAAGGRARGAGRARAIGSTSRTSPSLAAAPGRDAADALPPVGAMTIDEIERAMIVKSLRHHGGNISRVAESLGLSRAGALSPLREVRDHRVSLRGRGWSPTSSCCTWRCAGLGGWLVSTQPVLADRRRSRSSRVSLAVGMRPRARDAIGYRALAAEGLRLVRDEEFTSRFLPVGAARRRRADRASTTAWSITCATSACGSPSSTSS